MKQVVEENAERKAANAFTSGWLIACIFLAASCFIPSGIPFFVYLFAVIVVAVVVQLAVMRSARRSASRAYELGEAQGAIDAWCEVRDEIERGVTQKDT